VTQSSEENVEYVTEMPLQAGDEAHHLSQSTVTDATHNWVVECEEIFGYVTTEGSVTSTSNWKWQTSSLKFNIYRPCIFSNDGKEENQL